MIRTITDDFLKTLIECEKKVTTAPSKLKENRGHLKTDFELSSIDEQFKFNGFIRQNSAFIENFSIGLEFNPKWEKGSFCLLRFNGPHGKTLAHPHHLSPHIHKTSADIINAGLKSESIVESTIEYNSLDDALFYFIRYVNIRKEDQKHFNLKVQPGLFKNET